MEAGLVPFRCHLDAACLGLAALLLLFQILNPYHNFSIIYISIYLQIAVSYQSLDILQEHGVAATDIQKLNAAGYHTVESVRWHSCCCLFSVCLCVYARACWHGADPPGTHLS